MTRVDLALSGFSGPRAFPMKPFAASSLVGFACAAALAISACHHGASSSPTVTADAAPQRLSPDVPSVSGVALGPIAVRESSAGTRIAAWINDSFGRPRELQVTRFDPQAAAWSALETLAPYPVTAPLEAEHLDLRGAPSPTPPRRLRH